MSIKSLPASTVRILGSSQVLTDSSSVIKELIDNSLDAHATSISVEISSNTLDVIQVRDNGHGIAAPSRELLCKRYCTSKIVSEADLRDIGGRSLGFRGEALASAAELSGNLIITTRVDGETVAVSLYVARSGAITTQERSSHPVGTTVRLNDLFEPLVVRKQTALKQPARVLARVRSLMQAYALARPSVRFSFRVLKAKDTKYNFTYAPSLEHTIEDAVVKVISKRCAAECVFRSLKKADFEVQAFLPSEHAKLSNINHVGHYISVDTRPVAAKRGLLGNVVKTYKQMLKRVTTEFQDIKTPFLWLNIICPPGSYDVNIEPAKDDVVFEDSDKVLDCVTELLSISYPGISTFTKPDASLHHTIHVGPLTTLDYCGSKQNDDDQTMLFDVEGYLGAVASVPGEHGTTTEQHAEDRVLGNPWTIARAIAPNKTDKPIPHMHNGAVALARANITPIKTALPPRSPWQLPTPEQSSTSALDRSDSPPTPQSASSEIAGFHIQSPASAHDHDDSAYALTTLPGNVRLPDRRACAQLGLMTCAQPSSTVHFTQPSDDACKTSSPLLYRSQQREPRPQKQGGFSNKPFVPPTRDPSAVWFTHLPSSETQILPQRKAQRSNHDIRNAFAKTVPRTAKPQQRDKLGVALEQGSGTIHEYDSVHDYVRPRPAKRRRSNSDEMSSAPEDVAADRNAHTSPRLVDHGFANLVEPIRDAWPLTCARDLNATVIHLEICLALLHRLSSEVLLTKTEVLPGNPYDQELPFTVAADASRKTLPIFSSLSMHERSIWHSRLLHLLRASAATLDHSNVPAFDEALAHVAEEVAAALPGL